MFSREAHASHSALEGKFVYKTFRAVSAVLMLVAFLGLYGAPASAAENPPCYAQNGHLYCGDEAPSPLYAAPSFGKEDSRGAFHPTPVVDTLTSNPSYFECWVEGEQHPGGNNIWYYTHGDVTGRGGYIPAANVYAPEDPFPGVTHCAIPPSPPGTPPESPLYEVAEEDGFGPYLSPNQQRAIFHTGALVGDDGILVLRGFIPYPSAANGLLNGDARGFSSTPRLSSLGSRFYLTWELATGLVSLVVNPSTLRPLSTGFNSPEVAALPIVNECPVGHADGKARTTNDATVSGDNQGLHVCASMLNSVTNRVPATAWAADFFIDISPDSTVPGGYHVRAVGNGYPALEAYHYPRFREVADTLFLRRVDPEALGNPVDPGGGLAALDYFSWFSCVNNEAYASQCTWAAPTRPVPQRHQFEYTTAWPT